MFIKGFSVNKIVKMLSRISEMYRNSEGVMRLLLSGVSLIAMGMGAFYGANRWSEYEKGKIKEFTDKKETTISSIDNLKETFGKKPQNYDEAEELTFLLQEPDTLVLRLHEFTDTNKDSSDFPIAAQVRDYISTRVESSSNARKRLHDLNKERSKFVTYEESLEKELDRTGYVRDTTNYNAEIKERSGREDYVTLVRLGGLALAGIGSLFGIGGFIRWVKENSEEDSSGSDEEHEHSLEGEGIDGYHDF
jgi:hypothetical protein